MESTKQIFSPLTIESSNGRDIAGFILSQNGKVIILSNMDTNELDEWSVLIDKLLQSGHTIISYTYNRKDKDCFYDLIDVMSHVEKKISKRFFLVGASRGGVISLKSAIESDYRDNISAVIALSAPQVYEGELFYSDEDIKKINIPVYLINSEYDEAVTDTKKMYEILDVKKEILICSGSSHGTEMFCDNGDLLLNSIENFISSI